LVAALAAGLSAVLVTLSAPPAHAETIREMQWFLTAVNATQAQRVTGGDNVVVGVLDSGVDATHPDLAGAVLPGASFLGSRSQAGQTDPQGHGTKMAGVIAARGGGPNNALGIAPKAKILPVAVPVEGTIGSIAEPVRWAVDRGAKVLNISLSRDPGERAIGSEAEAIAYAVAKDVVVVISAGNAATRPRGNALAMLPGVVAVSGTNKSGAFSPVSVQGPYVALAAPAEDIVGAAARNVHTTGYSAGDGTSESAAIVSGVAALIRARYPSLNAANVINRLIRTAVDKGPAGRDAQYGFGVVEANRALTVNVPSVPTNPLGTPSGVPSGPASGSPTAGSTARAGGDAGDSGASGIVLALLIGGGLLLVLVVAIVIWLVARPKRKPVPVGAYPGQPHQPPYPQYPPGPPAPPGPPQYPQYPPTQQYPAQQYPPPPPGYPPQQPPQHRPYGH
jgi:subtilisin family serine protease